MSLSTSFLNRLLLVFLLCLLTAQAYGADASSGSAGPTIAVFPIENLSGAPAPLKETVEELFSTLKKAGLNLIPPDIVNDFIESQHLRYLGGLDEKTAALLREKTGADLVMISTIELYSEVQPPKFSFISRLVRLEGMPEIVWMDSVGLAGDDAPGFLGLGVVRDVQVLRKRGIRQIATSLRSSMDTSVFRKRLIPVAPREEPPFTLKNLIQGMTREKPHLEMPGPTRTTEPETVEELLKRMQASGGLFLSRYAPLEWYRVPEKETGRERTIAIVPFFNRSTRKHAADLQVLHLAKQLVINGRFRLLELGVIRDKMLSMHVIMRDGISIPSIDLITISLGVDLLLSGQTFDYLDTVGYGSYPKVDFSIQMFERESKKILWTSHSHNQGDDGVWFFDYGRVATAGALADKMCRALVLKLVENAPTTL